MSAWIEGDVTFVGDENASETTERLHQWASEHCKKAVRICSHGTSRSKGIPPHVSLLFHGHPASEEFLRAVKRFKLDKMELRGTVTGLRLAPTQSMILLGIECREMCDLFDEVYHAVQEGTGFTPKHRLSPEFYKQLAPHVTLAHYENREDAENDLKWSCFAQAQLFGREVVIHNFRLYQWTKETGAVHLPW